LARRNGHESSSVEETTSLRLHDAVPLVRAPPERSSSSSCGDTIASRSLRPLQSPSSPWTPGILRLDDIADFARENVELAPLTNTT
jgi:hypothetical protein